MDEPDIKPWWAAGVGLVTASLAAVAVMAFLRPGDVEHGHTHYKLQGRGSSQQSGCCAADMAECLACKVGWSVEEYCARYPHGTVIAGCSKGRPCCIGQRAECLACQEGLALQDYCSQRSHIGVTGCATTRADNLGTHLADADQPLKDTADGTLIIPQCCQEPIAKCFACKKGQTVKVFCADHTNINVTGCERMCGKVEDNYNYPGGDLYHKDNVLSADACCDKCSAEPRCTQWSWGKMHSRTEDPFSGTCYLKRQVEFIRTRDTGFVSGLPSSGAMTFQIKNRHGICLDWEDQLHLAPCGGADIETQQWSLDTSLGKLKTSRGACLDSVEFLSKGGGVHMQPCVGSVASQGWDFDGIAGLIKHKHGFCIDAEARSSAGSLLRMWPCDASSERQLWSMWNTEALGEQATQAAMQMEALETTTTTTATTTPTSTVTATTTTVFIGPSLFCFSLMLPWGYEPQLLQMQITERRSIFACDEFAVYSNKVMNLSVVRTRVVDTNLHCKIGGAFGTALNTPIFIEVWRQLIRDGRYQFHDWTVKADPDAVFIPDRLRLILRVDKDISLDGKGEFVCNCKFGLHGPLEVVSRRAIDTYAAGWKTCKQPPQEDVYLQQCLLHLEVKQVDHFKLLAEDHCESKDWATCQSQHVAFHPFKSVPAYLKCLASADVLDQMVN